MIRPRKTGLTTGFWQTITLHGFEKEHMVDPRKKALKLDINEVVRNTPDYPNRLEKLADPPARIFVCGHVPKGPMIGIVGSRNADISSMRFASRLAAQATESGLTVISGGALGIDTAAHEGALAGNGMTVAVIGSGFDYMYPQENSDLFSQIAERGALATEYMPSQPPTKWTFPKRNRLVAALASAVVVVQAGEKSGALITARLAFELNVPVGAVPGGAGDVRNRGSNGLLRKGAAVVENGADILALIESEGSRPQLELPGIQPAAVDAHPVAIPNLSNEEGKILDILGSQPIHIDEIAANIGLGSGETSAAILSLEIAGLAADLGGKNFIKVG